MITKINIFKKLNESYGNIDKPWYHGSNFKISKFNYKNIGKGNDRITNYHGFGLYFTSDKHNAKKYGDYLYTVKISENVDLLKNKITKSQCLKIYNGFINNNINISEKTKNWLLNPNYGKYSVMNDIEEFYDCLLRFYTFEFEEYNKNDIDFKNDFKGQRLLFKNSEEVSNFLFECGIDGLIVKNDVKTEILVMFNDSMIEIEKTEKNILNENRFNIKIDRKTIFNYIDWQNTCRDLYPGYSKEENDFTDEYFFETEEKANNYADEVIDIFISLPNPIPIYRCIKANTIDDIDLEMPGESWSFEKQSALDFGSRNGSNYLLSCFVNKQDVNWQGTINAYTLFSGNYTDEDENEIVVDDWNVLKDIQITKLK